MVHRYESLRHCRWVDEVVTDAPWYITDEFMAEHDVRVRPAACSHWPPAPTSHPSGAPQIDFVCHDALPYGAPGTDATSDIYYPFKVTGHFWETKRTEGVSTSEMIIRIVKDYDEFVRRNLSRGHTAKEMNVPFMKEKALQLDMAFEGVKEAVRDSPVVRNVGEKVDELQLQFTELFGKNSSLVSLLRHYPCPSRRLG